MIWCVIWVVLMILWVCFGVYTRDPVNRVLLGGTFIPWVCVLILGLILFGAVAPPGPIR